MDILVGIDTSGSIGHSSFQVLKQFLSDLVLHEISDSSRIGFYMFATDVNKSRDIQYWNQTDLANFVDGLWWSGGWTNTVQLLSDALVQFADTKIPDRKQILLMATDGIFNIISYNYSNSEYNNFFKLHR